MYVAAARRARCDIPFGRTAATPAVARSLALGVATAIQKPQGSSHMSRTLPVLALASVLCAGLPAAVRAQAPTTPPKDSIQADGNFVRRQAADNMMEVQLGQLAEHHAMNPIVQKFGEKMAIDHQRLQDQWTGLADKHGMRFKPALASAQQGTISRLEKTDRSTFDRDYLITMIKGHTRDAADLKAAVDSARSEPVRKMAAYALPIVQEHLQNARAAAKEIGLDSSAVARSKVAETE
jgi:putative membrane protein